MSEERKSTFELLNAINVNDKVKTKMGLKYLSWSEAWNILKTNFPDATSVVYTRKSKTTETTTFTDQTTGMTRTVVTETENEIPYFSDGNSCYVKVGVVINDVEYFEIYPIMNLKNSAIPASMVTMTDVNKSIQRAFVKACARHGLGLYVYSGEDLPDADKIVLNFNEIGAKADAAEVGACSSVEEFNGLKSMVISKLQASWDQNVSDAIMAYAGAKLSGKRVSTLENTPADYEVLVRINSYIGQIESILSGK